MKPRLPNLSQLQKKKRRSKKQQQNFDHSISPPAYNAYRKEIVHAYHNIIKTPKTL